MMSAYAPYGGDSYDDDGGGHPDWPPNLKLKAVRDQGQGGGGGDRSDDEVEDVQSGDSLGRWLG